MACGPTTPGSGQPCQEQSLAAQPSGDAFTAVAAFKTANDSQTESPLQWSSATVGGRSVEVAQSAGESTYLYVKDDTLFFIGASTQAVTEEILNACHNGQVPADRAI